MASFFLTVGLIAIFVSGISINAWTSGDRQRANFFSETREHRNFRTKIGMVSGLVGVICFVIAGLVYFS